MYSLLVCYSSTLENRDEYFKRFDFIMNDNTKKTILDVGCGLGSEFIYVMLRYFPDIKRDLILLYADPSVFKRKNPGYNNGREIDEEYWKGRINSLEYLESNFNLDRQLRLGADAVNYLTSRDKASCFIDNPCSI